MLFAEDLRKRGKLVSILQMFRLNIKRIEAEKISFAGVSILQMFRLNNEGKVILSPDDMECFNTSDVSVEFQIISNDLNTIDGFNTSNVSVELV